MATKKHSSKDSSAGKGNSKRKVDWYEMGRKEALTYWRQMRTEPEEEHIGGYIAVAHEFAHKEAQAKGDKDEPGWQSEFIKGLGVGLQEGIEDLMKRASLFDGIVRAVKEARHA